MTKLSLTLLLALLLGTAASGCGSEAEEAPTSVRDAITVTGDFGERPGIKVLAPLEIEETTSWVAGEAGTGDKVGETATVVLQITLADGRTGKTAVSTFDQGQRPLEVQLGESVFPALSKSLVGQPAGSRIVVASTSDDAYGDKGAPQIGIKAGDPVVMVVDILTTDPETVLEGPTGATLKAPATAPRVREQGGAPVSVDVAKLRKPKKLVVVPLREGTGPEITSPDRVSVNYVGQVWGAKKPFESSFGGDSLAATIGLGGVIKGWDQGLEGVKEGARVMLVIPPSLGYGKTDQGEIPADSTLVFVIDVLGVG